MSLLLWYVSPYSWKGCCKAACAEGSWVEGAAGGATSTTRQERYRARRLEKLIRVTYSCAWWSWVLPRARRFQQGSSRIT